MTDQAEALALAIKALERIHKTNLQIDVFVRSRQQIKEPEGWDWWAQEQDAVDQVLDTLRSLEPKPDPTEELRARVSVLEEALRPFAEAYANAAADGPCLSSNDVQAMHGSVWIDDFCKAYAALNGANPHD